METIINILMLIWIMSGIIGFAIGTIDSDQPINFTKIMKRKNAFGKAQCIFAMLIIFPGFIMYLIGRYIAIGILAIIDLGNKK